MCVTVPIRPFIKDITQSIIYNNFHQLAIINKHHHLEINWLALTFYLNDNTAAARISYEASAVKKKKIQRLMKLLPTMEVLKVRHPQLFDPTWLCVKCECDYETFTYIWECPILWTNVKLIITDSQLYLRDLINNDFVFVDI